MNHFCITGIKESYFQVIFSRKIREGFQPNLYFNDQLVQRSGGHNYLGLTADKKLLLTNCLDDKINKTLKGVGLLHKLSMLLPWQSFLTIYKSFIRSHLDYYSIIYDLPLNESLSKRIESVQYKAALAITGVWQGSSQEKLYQEVMLLITTQIARF